MRVEDLLESNQDIEEWKATKELCKSKRPDNSLGASALASCKAQGLRKRSNKRLPAKRLKSDDYGGPVDDYKYVYKNGKRIDYGSGRRVPGGKKKKSRSRR